MRNKFTFEQDNITHTWAYDKISIYIYFTKKVASYCFVYFDMHKKKSHAVIIVITVFEVKPPFKKYVVLQKY